MLHRILNTFLDIFGNVDLRIVAVILAIFSVAGGMFISFYLLLILTATLVIVGFLILFFGAAGPSYGTSGGLGMLYIVAGSCICLIVPAWLAYMLKLIVLATN